MYFTSVLDENKFSLIDHCFRLCSINVHIIVFANEK